MQTIGSLRNRKGFSTLLLVLLGAIFFGIAGAMVLLMNSEGDQMLHSANSARGESRLDFMAQTMQADFYNNFLQTGFERDVVNFLMTQGPHTIDPTKTFMQNLGGRLQSYLSERARSLVAGDANAIYAVAYSAFPDVECTPHEVEGATTNVGLREAGGGALEVSSWTIGQEVSCEDKENNAKRDILLEARDYRLQTRALEMHDAAVEAIDGVMIQLDYSEGTYLVGGNAWRLDENEQSKKNVAESWNGLIRSIGYAFFWDGRDGILLKPTSVKVTPGSGQQLYEPQDMRVVCYGDIMPASQGGKSIQTCRPENLNITLGKKLGTGQKGADLEFKVENGATSADIFVEYSIIKDLGIKINAQLGLGSIGKVLQKAADIALGDLNSGNVKYSGVTRLCNSFKGKPNSAVVSGTILETDTKYLPPGTTYINFDFLSTVEDIDNSGIKNDKTCEGNDNVIRQNIFALLTNYGKKDFVLNIEAGENEGGNAQKKTPKITEASLNEVAKTIAANNMYSTTGENKEITLRASVNNLGASSAKAQPGGNDKPAEAANSIASTTPPLADLNTQVVNLLNSAPPIQALNTVRDTLDKAATELTSLGKLTDAESVAKAASTACKMMGLKNWLEIGDNYKALLAVCGIASIADKEAGAKICGIAGLYQTVKSGNVMATLEQLSNLLGMAGFHNLVITAESVQEAVKSGNLEATLSAASSVTRLLGEPKAADYLAAAATLSYNLKYNKDVLSAAASVFAAIGDTKTAGFFGSLRGLELAINSKDARAILSAAGQVAQKLGYSGLAQLGGIITRGESLIHTLANLDELFNACSALKWDWPCVLPQIGGGICEDKWGSCTFLTGVPAFDVELMCNDMIFDLGFQIDCECTYTCPQFPYAAIYQKSVGINLREIAMRLNPEQYAHMFDGMSLENLLATGDLMQYCRLDP